MRMRIHHFLLFGVFFLLTNAGEAQELTANDSLLNYIIQPKDVILVEVFQEPELEREIRVAADGTVSLPLIGVVKIGGLSVVDAREKIEVLYNKDYLVEPHVNLLVTAYTEKRVEVLGRVNRPGTVLIPPEEALTLTQAISGAGGPNQLANLSKVRLTRVSPDGKTEVMNINFSNVSKGKLDDIELQDGDSIFVEERVW